MSGIRRNGRIASFAAVGTALGLLRAWWIATMIAGYLPSVRAVEPAICVFSALCVLGLAVAAAMIPARRAASVDPATTLRSS